MSRWWNSQAAINALTPGINRGLLKIAEQVEEKAATMMRGPHGGRIYTTYFITRGAGPNRVVIPVSARSPHQASAPGEAPAVDTGRLIRSSEIQNYPNEFRVVVRWTDSAAARMQLGTDRIEPRPFASLALFAVAPTMAETMAAEIRIYSK